MLPENQKGRQRSQNQNQNQRQKEGNQSQRARAIRWQFLVHTPRRKEVVYVGGTSPGLTVLSASSMSMLCPVATLFTTTATKNQRWVVLNYPTLSTLSPPQATLVTGIMMIRDVPGAPPGHSSVGQDPRLGKTLHTGTGVTKDPPLSAMELLGIVATYPPVILMPSVFSGRG